MRKALLLIGLGGINILHGLLHLIQFIQSILLVGNILPNNRIETILHSKVLTLVWAIVGIITLYIGIRDFTHHKNCK